MDSQLSEFVEHARDRGLDPETVRQVLVSAGWRDGDIAEALCARELDLPVPKPSYAVPTRSRGTGRSGSPWPRRAREVFLHLLAFGALFTWVTVLIILLMKFVDLALPDRAQQMNWSMMEYMRSAMRGQVASLIVAYPLFLGLWHYLLREVRRDTRAGKGAIRRWLTYLTLFVGAVTLAGDLVTLVYFLLEGELTMRILLKAGVLFGVTGGVVLYLGLTTRSESEADR